MDEITQIDRKIIYELSINSRLSYKELAKKIDSKKDTVAYHVNQLIDNKVITKFLPVFSLSKLNILTYKIYFKLQGLTPDKEKELYDYLVNSQKIDWVVKVLGQWDLFIGLYSKTPLEFSKTKDELLSKFNDIITSYQVVQMADQTIAFGRDYLIDKPDVIYRKEFVFISQNEKTQLDLTDLKIINEIKNDGRFKYLDVSKKIGINEKTIRERIKKMKENNFLQGYTIFIDPKKINGFTYKLCIYLSDHDQKRFNELIDYTKLNPNVVRLIKSIGPWELEIELEASDILKIYEYTNQLKNKFSTTIKQIDISIMTDELKLNYFPGNY
ncbi:MAG: Lrp/AsnC family transcriptional regulator [archaeon]|jgi:DNA-binding Lrp family transcriptional regulator